ncbi:AlkA N-terminal domain-containing protein [Nocardioides sp.]|uniref:AlkA N-terminal domain-containing protein n=1 Tax=Nocardioides sp. TaxID=35761 RepID=UPI002628A7F9|nr:AlkA N-terminal domain-containing protein [Nocardioides sp.]
MSSTVPLDPDACYRAVSSRDRRFDGVFWTAVATTGIYCRPSCPARTPAARNVTFHPSAASAQAAGYRACKRCLPDATPGSPDWDLRADLAGRAMRLIADGVVDRSGVVGLATRLGYSERQLHRLLLAELGAGPLALARARRAQTARTLIEASDLTFTEIAFASGFSSVRQFNDTVREVYAASPTELRGRRRSPHGARAGTLALRLAVRTPFAGADLLAFLGLRAVPGIEVATATGYARTLRLPHSWGTVELDLKDLADRADRGDRGDPTGAGTGYVAARFRLDDLRDTAAAVERVRRLLDADCDPVAVASALGSDPLLAPLLAQAPGLRVPGHVDGDELAIRGVLGQQVTVVAARTLAGRLVAAHGTPIETGVPGLTHLFPDAATIAGLAPEEFAMPRARARALGELAARLADGRIDLSRGAARDDVRSALLAVPGIGPWTADYVAMRALGDPDVFLPTDVGVRHALQRLSAPDADIGSDAAPPEPETWKPWRSYALIHLWRSLTCGP